MHDSLARADAKWHRATRCLSASTSALGSFPAMIGSFLVVVASLEAFDRCAQHHPALIEHVFCVLGGSVPAADVFASGGKE